MLYWKEEELIQTVRESDRERGDRQDAAASVVVACLSPVTVEGWKQDFHMDSIWRTDQTHQEALSRICTASGSKHGFATQKIPLWDKAELISKRVDSLLSVFTVLGLDSKEVWKKEDDSKISCSVDE